MKLKPFIPLFMTAALAILSGCQSDSHNFSEPPSAKSKAPAAAPAAPASVAAPAVPAAPAAPKSSQPTIRINAGSVAVKDSNGVEWLGDTGFEGGNVVERPELEIANTKAPEIYRSEHYSMESFTYKVPNGKYQVKLHFCETFEGIRGPGERVFSFDVQGKTFKDFDVWVKSGGFARAYVQTVPVDITDGQLQIKFTPQVENPQINGIEIIPVP